nr:hypothetical protein [Tanacetum cinerariifolium]
MRTEHILREKKKLEGRCGRQSDLLKEKDAEIASLKAQLSLKKAETAKAIRLCDQVPTLESAAGSKDTKLSFVNAKVAKLNDDLSSLKLSFGKLRAKAATLESQKDSLTGQVSLLETTCFGLRDQVSGYEIFKGHIEAVQDKQVRVLSGRVVELDSDLMSMVLHLDEEFYPRVLTAIAGRRWILSRVVKLVVMKCLQSAKYLAVLGEAIGRAIDKGYAAGTPKANQLQPSPKQLMLPIRRLEDQMVIGETSLYFSLDVVHARDQRIRGDVASHSLSLYDVMVPLIEPLSTENFIGEASTFGVLATAKTTALSTTFIQTSSVLSISVANYEVSGAEPPTKVPSPPKIVFERRSWRLRRSMLRLIKHVAIVGFSVVILSLHRSRM